MYLFIESRGAKLKIKEGLFLVEEEDQKREYSPLSLSTIFLGESVSLTTAAVKTAIQHHIEVILADSRGKPYGLFWSPKCTNVAVRRKQLAYNGSDLANIVIKCKILNQYHLLASLFRSRKTEVNSSIMRLREIADELKRIQGNLQDVRNQIMGKEGQAADIYFSEVSAILPPKFKFRKRSKRPPLDRFNAMISYGYGILYGEVEKNCIVSGLDPYIGFLHSDNYGRISLALDLIELFRQPIVDRAVITLITQKKMVDADFIEESGGIYLTKSGKSKVIKSVVERLDTRIQYQGRCLKFRQLIFEVCHDLIAHYLEGKEFNGFVYDWH